MRALLDRMTEPLRQYKIFARLGKGELVALAALAMAALCLVLSLVALASQKARLKGASAENAEMREAAALYEEVSARVKAQETRRARVRADMGTVATLEQVLGPFGLMGKMKAQRGLPSTDLSEERAEVSFEGLTMNESVNLLYNLDTAQMLLIVRGMDLKSSFANPELLDLTLTLSLLKPATK